MTHFVRFYSDGYTMYYIKLSWKKLWLSKDPNVSTINYASCCQETEHGPLVLAALIVIKKKGAL